MLCSCWMGAGELPEIGSGELLGGGGLLAIDSSELLGGGGLPASWARRGAGRDRSPAGIDGELGGGSILSRDRSSYGLSRDRSSCGLSELGGGSIDLGIDPRAGYLGIDPRTSELSEGSILEDSSF